MPLTTETISYRSITNSITVTLIEANLPFVIAMELRLKAKGILSKEDISTGLKQYPY
jgi:hypothetical protein